MLKAIKFIEKENTMGARSWYRVVPYLLIIAILTSVTIYAGDASRVGTAAGVQVQVPVGARSLALAGADVANVTSVEAIYWNPAGLGNMDGRVATLFSNQSHFADISLNYFALGFNAGRAGVLGFSLKSFDFGDIPVTTVEQMDGTGANYSPTFATIGMTYARHFTDRISFGVTGKVIYESVPRASANAFAVDVGIQYRNFLQVNGLALGFVIKNIGTNMQYSGSGLLNKATESGETYQAYRYRPTSSDQIPSDLAMGISYAKDLGFADLLLCGQFLNANFEHDQLNVGAELTLMKQFYLRGGYTSTIKDTENKSFGESIYGMGLGGGVKLALGRAKLNIDYAYRPIKYFDNSSNIFSVGIQF